LLEERRVNTRLDLIKCCVAFRHVNEEHRQDGRSTAQLRVQMQVVSQLEIQVGYKISLQLHVNQH